MVKPLFDANILIDYLNGINEAREEFDRYQDPAISMITWIEVLVGASPAVSEATRAFLQSFVLIPIDQAVAERAVTLRQQYRMRLPDAIIWASADQNGRLLVTRNTKDFPADAPGIRVPYRL
jgi:predicted nucleic acid-binding protein